MKALLLLLLSFNVYASPSTDLAQIMAKVGTQGNLRYVYNKYCRSEHNGPRTGIKDYILANNAPRACMVAALTDYQAELDAHQARKDEKASACDTLKSITKEQFDAFTVAQLRTFVWHTKNCMR